MRMTKTCVTGYLSTSMVALAALLLSSSLPACGEMNDGATSDPAVAASVAQALHIGPQFANSLDYIQCATENQTCVLGTSSKYVAFGNQGAFTYKALSGNIACTIATFGVDPAPGVSKACYYANYAFVVNQNGTDHLIRHEIAYGANGVFNFGAVSGTWTCNDATFGDPLPGANKACYEAVTEFSQVATENQNMTGLSTSPVAYGAKGGFVFKILSGTASCSNATFGSDPAVGATKICYKFPINRVADENQTINITRPSIIYYGSGLDGKFMTLRVPVENGFQCTNATFGADPSVGPTKHCYLALQN
jgi:hypothetical protein